MTLEAAVPEAAPANPTLLKPKVLVVDDDQGLLRAVMRILHRAGHQVTGASDSVEGLAAALEDDLDVALLDVRMPNISGLQMLAEIKAKRPELEVIIMTAHATVETAVSAVKAGAYDYLTKPFDDIEQVVITVEKAFERKALRIRNAQLEAMLKVREPYEGLISESPKMRAIFDVIENVAPSMATVMIRGESGTGKELVARALHQRSPRRARPFVAINCSALTETLLESELFGHVRGAFTGAVNNKVGLFEAASGGTLFLDEVGDIPLSMQARLLRALQEGEIKRVGANDVVKTDVRVIAATHRDLGKLIASGAFREDLYYRLNVVEVSLPPLRERPEDIPLLVHHFLSRYGQQSGRRFTSVEPDAMEACVSHRWTGNVRELQHVIERAVLLGHEPVLRRADLPETIGVAKRGLEVSGVELYNLPYVAAKAAALKAFERRYLTNALTRAKGSISEAARTIGLDRSNLRRLMKQYGVEKLGAQGTGAAAEAEDADGAAESGRGNGTTEVEPSA
ncbi:MAG: sigma-54 dependent transcriptional regulator [Myxococcales bacterium]